MGKKVYKGMAWRVPMFVKAEARKVLKDIEKEKAEKAKPKKPLCWEDHKLIQARRGWHMI